MRNHLFCGLFLFHFLPLLLKTSSSWWPVVSHTLRKLVSTRFHSPPLEHLHKMGFLEETLAHMHTRHIFLRSSTWERNTLSTRGRLRSICAVAPSLRKEGQELRMLKPECVPRMFQYLGQSLQPRMWSLCRLWQFDVQSRRSVHVFYQKSGRLRRLECRHT